MSKLFFWKDRRRRSPDRRAYPPNPEWKGPERRKNLFDRRLLPGLAAIGFEEGGICVMRITRPKDGQPTISAYDYRAVIDPTRMEETLAELAGANHLKRTYCTTVLNSADYKLLIMEPPDVPEAELISALRWRIKDFIDIPVKDATLDTFEAPQPVSAGSQRSLYVVAARSKSLEQRVALMHTTGVNLKMIDITELAQRNIAALLPEDPTGVAVLWLQPNQGMITLTRDKQLYLSRNLGVGLNDIRHQLNGGVLIDQIVLEIQRSLDYYESHFRLAPIRHLYLAPLAVEMAGMIEYLQQNLSVQVRQVELDKLIACDLNLPQDWQIKHFITIGAALREEGTNT